MAVDSVVWFPDVRIGNMAVPAAEIGRDGLCQQEIKTRRRWRREKLSPLACVAVSTEMCCGPVTIRVYGKMALVGGAISYDRGFAMSSTISRSREESSWP